MKKSITILALILSTYALSMAATKPTKASGIESSTTIISPYARQSEVVSGTSSIVVPLNDWEIAESNTKYTTSFVVPIGWLNRQIFVRVGYASSSYRVVVNGSKVAFSPFGAFAVQSNITKYIHQGRNTISFILDKDEPTAKMAKIFADGLKDVAILSKPALAVRDIFCKTTINSVGNGVVECGVALKCYTLNRKKSSIKYNLIVGDTTVVATGYRDVSLDMRGEDTLRFVAQIPRDLLWEYNKPNMLKLAIDNRIDGRTAEYILHKVGIRSTEISYGTLYINNKPTPISAVEYKENIPFEKQIVSGKNCFIIDTTHATEEILTSCDEKGMLAIVVAPLNTLSMTTSIKKGGNPTNDPRYIDTFVGCAISTIKTYSAHPSLVGIMLGNGTTTGIAIYEAYLAAKSLFEDRLVIYEGANGEWCSDKVDIR